MKVNNPTVSGLKSISESEEAARGDGAASRPASGEDSDSAIVDLGGMATVKRYATSAASGSTGDAARLARIREAVAAGAYRPRLEVVAESLVQESLLLDIGEELDE